MGAKNIPPTRKRLRQAREDGDVAKSQNLTGAVKLSACFAMLFYCRSRFGMFITFMIQTFTCPQDFSTNNMLVCFADAVGLVFVVVVPVVILAAMSSCICEAAQTGAGFSFKAIAPRFTRLGLFAGLKRIFISSRERDDGLPIAPVVEAVKLALYLASLAGAFTILLLRSDIAGVLQSYASPEGVLEAADLFALQLIPGILGASLAVGILDLLILRRQRFKRLQMDAEEYKRELRENEGDPQHRAARRQLHREYLRQQAVQQVREARVLLVSRGTD